MGDLLPEGATLLGMNPDGTAKVRGPKGMTLDVPVDSLSDSDRKAIGIGGQQPGFLARNVPGALAAAGGFVEGLNRNLPDFAPKTAIPDVIASPDDVARVQAQNPRASAAGQMGGAVVGGVNELADPTMAWMRNGGGNVLGALAYGNQQSRGAMAATPPNTGGLQPADPNLVAQVSGQQPGPGGALPAGAVQIPPPMRIPGAPDYSGQAGRAYDEQGRALLEQGQSEQARQQGFDRNAAQVSAQQAQAYQEAMAKRQAIQDEFRTRMQQLDQAQAKLDEQKEDPNHLWNSMSGGQKAAAIISQALGAFGQAFTGHNGSPIQHMIDQDIEAQRMNYQRARDSLNTKRTAYAQLREQGLSDTEAMLTLRAKQLDATKAQMDAMVSEKTPPPVMAKYRAAAAEIQAESAKTKAQLTQAAAVTAHTNVETAMAKQSMAAQQQQMAAMARGQIPPAMADRAVYLPNGQAIVAGSKEEAEKLRSVHRASSDIADAVDKMQAIVKANPLDVMRPGSQAHREYAALKDNVINQLNASKGINAQMQEPQRKLYEDLMDPTLAGSTEALANALGNFKGETLASANKAFQLATGRGAFAAPPSSLNKVGR